MNQLAVFGKYWESGQVKTRLAEAIGAQAAAEVYRVFLSTTIHRCSAIDAQRTLVYWPPERRTEMSGLAGDDWDIHCQAEGNLGDRMLTFFEQAFKTSPSRVVLIGSDSPNLPLSLIELAFKRLQDVPIVLGPSEDGGYYLVGATRVVPEVFTDIDWSSSQVWQQTVANLQKAGVHYEKLPLWYDVDEKADLDRLYTDLLNEDVGDRHLANLAAQVRSAIDRTSHE